MPIYRVTVQETIYRSTEIEADSSQEARKLAEQQDWREWFVDTDTGGAEIVEVTYIADEGNSA